MNYKVTISDTGHDSYGAWRESIHDDLVFAVGLAVWSSDRFGGGVTVPLSAIRKPPTIPTMGGWNPRDGIPRM
jgi:hypothetical protein